MKTNTVKQTRTSKDRAYKLHFNCFCDSCIGNPSSPSLFSEVFYQTTNRSRFSVFHGEIWRDL